MSRPEVDHHGKHSILSFGLHSLVMFCTVGITAPNDMPDAMTRKMACILLQISNIDNVMPYCRQVDRGVSMTSARGQQLKVGVGLAAPGRMKGALQKMSLRQTNNWGQRMGKTTCCFVSVISGTMLSISHYEFCDSLDFPALVILARH